MNPDAKKIGLWQAVSLAVGAMIGASIFSIFRLGARIVGISLFLDGIALLILSYATVP